MQLSRFQAPSIPLDAGTTTPKRDGGVSTPGRNASNRDSSAKGLLNHMHYAL